MTPANPVQHAPQPFGEFARSVSAQAGLRAAITRHYRAPEMECLPRLFSEARPADRAAVRALAEKLVHALRRKQSGVGVDALIHEFALSTQEGVALMCLAEALLRIPDTATRDALIRDKIAQGNWRAYLGESPSLFVNAATWGLMLTIWIVSLFDRKPGPEMRELHEEVNAAMVADTRGRRHCCCRCAHGEDAPAAANSAEDLHQRRMPPFTILPVRARVRSRLFPQSGAGYRLPRIPVRPALLPCVAHRAGPRGG